jgi:methionine-rich copper-binding protein CopC
MSRFARALPSLRALSVTVLAGLALLLAASPALAHTRLVSSDPADGAGLDTAPSSVALTFNDDVATEFATITVVGPDGAEWQAGEVTGTDGTLSVPVRPLGPAGRYEIGYRVVSDDGHPITGRVAFTLTTPGPGASAPTTAAAVPAEGTPAESEPVDGPAGMPAWPWVLGVVVLVGGGVIAALRLGRG